MCVVLQAKLEEKRMIDDLENSNKTEVSSLTIHQRDRYLTGPTEITNVPSIHPDQVCNYVFIL